MSGHSHWHSIRHKKQLEDQRRGKIFSKLARQISIAAKEGGKNPETNPKLRLAIEQAKTFNMPFEKIEKAIKRGVGELEGGTQLESFTFEAYGPNRVAIIIEGITDNKNRTLGEIKQILTQYESKLAETGSVRWLFERKGSIIIDYDSQSEDVKNKENLELQAIEAGAEDIKWHDGQLEIYTKVEDLEKVKNNLENQGIKIERVSLDWVAKEEIKLSEKEKEKYLKLFEALDESESVQEIYSNLKL